MSVVNCKVKFLREEGYANLKEWVANPQNVYVGRAGVVFVKEGEKQERFPKTASPFCNPFKVGKDGTRDEVIAKFREFLRAKIQSHPAFLDELLLLKGKTLGCWCKPEACHGDVLLEVVNSL